MSIVIEQTQRNMLESHAFSSRAAILGVKVVSATFSAPKELPSEVEEALTVGVRFTPQETNVIDGSVHITTLFECVVAETIEAEELEPLAKFECSLAATYDIHEDYVPTEAELDAFRKTNVIFNCWPYFREFVQSAACRMNIPPPPVPFVRVQVIPDASAPPSSPGPEAKVKKRKPKR